MKTVLRILLLVTVTGPATAQPSPPPAAADRTSAESVVAPDKGGVDDALGRAATRPLRDINVVKPKISPELRAIMANPYAMTGLRTCRQLNGEVRRMTALVGPDVDDPALVGARDRSPVEQLFDTAEGITGSLIPGQGIIRQLSGANKAARQANAARLAGQLRRSYIKGMMKARGCRLTLAATAAAKR